MHIRTDNHNSTNPRSNNNTNSSSESLRVTGSAQPPLRLAYHKPVTNHVKVATEIPAMVMANPRARLSLSDRAALHVPQTQPEASGVYGWPVYKPNVRAALAVKEPGPAVAVTLDSAS